MAISKKPDPLSRILFHSFSTNVTGIGLRIISENKIYRGYQGFAGEIGHMIVEPNGLLCSCGNKGCWELYASEKSLNHYIIQQKNTILSCPEDLERIMNTTEFEPILDHYYNYLAIGLNNIINISNPEIIILNGTLLNGNSTFITNVYKRLQSKMNNYGDIRFSRLGKDASALGGAAIALKTFFGVNTVNFSHDNYYTKLQEFNILKPH